MNDLKHWYIEDEMPREKKAKTLPVKAEEKETLKEIKTEEKEALKEEKM